MTGQGDAELRDSGTTVAVEVRTLNSRYFKLTLRGSEGCLPWEPRIEAVIRQSIRRGTAQVTVRLDREAAPDLYRLNTAALAGYYRHLQAFVQAQGLAEPIRVELLLALPGVVAEPGAEGSSLEAQWPLCEQALRQALENLDRMRSDEGKAMGTDLVHSCRGILAQLDQISERAPRVAEAYRARLTERLNRLLHEFDTEVAPADIVREVGTFAERSDISEEVFRLRSHLDQFQGFLAAPESSGRKLDFLTQEMFREANTIGSKANDADIAGHVVEIKALIERMREMIQNIE
jgi:uncharacterized protein (TIGR00255 family)